MPAMSLRWSASSNMAASVLMPLTSLGGDSRRRGNDAHRLFLLSGTQTHWRAFQYRYNMRKRSASRSYMQSGSHREQDRTLKVQCPFTYASLPSTWLLPLLTNFSLVYATLHPSVIYHILPLSLYVVYTYGQPWLWPPFLFI